MSIGRPITNSREHIVVLLISDKTARLAQFSQEFIGVMKSAIALAEME